MKPCHKCPLPAIPGEEYCPIHLAIKAQKALKVVYPVFPFASGWVVREYVPISLIAEKTAWSSERFQENLELIKQKGNTPPIALGFRKDTGKFHIIDGIHRFNVAKQLGYETIPAEMSQKDAQIFDRLTTSHCF